MVKKTRLQIVLMLASCFVAIMAAGLALQNGAYLSFVEEELRFAIWPIWPRASIETVVARFIAAVTVFALLIGAAAWQQQKGEQGHDA